VESLESRSVTLIQEDPAGLNIVWRVSPVRERLKRGASNQARNRKRRVAMEKHATVERVATPRSLLRNTHFCGS
jgi:hypothetical protein